VFAIKPFCSGGRADAELLHSLQNGDLTLDEINPYHFSEPVAPLVAARLHNRKITLQQTLRHLQQISAPVNPSIHHSKNPKIHSITPILLIEGAGGLLAPLGESFNLLDLILALAPTTCPKSRIQIIVVASNHLGVINHTILTVEALQSRGFPAPKVVLIDTLPPQHSTPDTRSNPSILTELLSPIPLFHIPNLGKNPSKTAQIEKFAKKFKKTLAQILA
jgi:dethiobiotin synthetase